MRTTTQVSLFTIAGLVFAPAVLADEESHRQSAEQLLKAMHVDNQLQTSINQMVDLQVKSNPQIAPQGDTIKKFLYKHMSWESLKDELITIYTEAFTEAELKQVTAFYETPAGKKMVEKMPELMSKGMQLGLKRVQSNQSELRQMLEEAAKNNQ